MDRGDIGSKDIKTGEVKPKAKTMYMGMDFDFPTSLRFTPGKKNPGLGEFDPVLKRDHTPRNLPAILRSIETKKILRGDAPSRTEVSKAKTRLEVQL